MGIRYAVSGASRLWRCANTDAATPDWVDVAGTGQSNPLPSAPVNTVARAPWNPDAAWFVGTDIGVFYTSDGGASWTNITQPYGLPNTPVRVLHAVDGSAAAPAAYLYAATWGRGVWRTQIAPK